MKSKLHTILTMLFIFIHLPLMANGSQEISAPVEIGNVSNPMAKYDPPITVTTFFEIAPPLADYFTKDRILNGIFANEYMNELGINIDYKWFAAQTDEDSVQKKNIAIASGDIPDFMMVNKEQLALLSRTDLINKNMGEYFEVYASDHLKEWMYKEGTAAMDSATFNNYIIGIPSTDSSIATSAFLWIRNDWLQNVGLEIPTSIDELYNVMVAFRDNDPDKNGKKDTIGLILHKDILSQRGISDAGDALGLFNSFGAYPRIWVKNTNGKLVYGSIQPEIKTALTFMNKLYFDGLLEEDFAVKDLNKVSELSASSKGGIQFGAYWNAIWPLQSSVDNNPKADWIAIPIPSSDNNPSHPQIKLNVPLYYVVSKKAKNPEAVIKLLNFYVEKYGYIDEVEYKKYLINDTGVEAFAMHDTMFKIFNATQSLEAYWHINEAFEKKSITGLTAEEINYYNSIISFQNGDLSSAGSVKTFGKEGSLKSMDYYYKNDLFEMDQFFGAPTDLMKKRMQTIKDKEIEFYTKVIIGAESIDSFENFVNELNTLGLSDITNEVNTWFSKR